MSLNKRVYGLTGWGMPPDLIPCYDLEGVAVEPLAAFPLYFDEDVGEAVDVWTTNYLLDWLDRQLFPKGLGSDTSSVFPVKLVAWSMGGLLALLYAHHYPEKVSSLEVWGASPCFAACEPEWFGQSSEAIEVLRQSIMSEDVRFLDRFLKSQIPTGAMYRELRIAFMVSYHEAMKGRTFLKDGLLRSLAWLERTDIRALLSHIHVPITVCHGTEDKIIPVQAGEYLVQYLSKASWVSYLGLGHAAWFHQSA